MLLYYCIVQINYLVRSTLPFAMYLKSVWSLNVHKFSVEKLAHSDRDSEDD